MYKIEVYMYFNLHQMWYLDPWFYVAAVGGVGALISLSILIVRSATTPVAQIKETSYRSSNHIRF